MSRNTQSYGSFTAAKDDSKLASSRGSDYPNIRTSHLDQSPAAAGPVSGYPNHPPANLSSARPSALSVNTSFASHTSDAYAEASLNTSPSSPDHRTRVATILNDSPRSTKHGSQRRRRSVALQSTSQPHGVSKSSRRQSTSSAMNRQMTDSSTVSPPTSSHRRRPVSMTLSGGEASGSHNRKTSIHSLSNVLTNEPGLLPPLSRVSPPFRQDNTASSAMTTPTLSRPPTSLPPPTQQSAMQGFNRYGVPGPGYFPPAHTNPITPIPQGSFTPTHILQTTSAPSSPPSGNTTAVYDMVASLIRHSGSETGSQSRIAGPPVLAMDLSEGIVEVQVDSTSGSKNSDQKRKNNAAASKRFRNRRKEATIQQNRRMQELELMEKQQKEVIERLERQLNQERTARQELESLVQRAQQQGFQIPSTRMRPGLPPMSALPPPDASRTPGIGSTEQRNDYFGRTAMESIPPTAASTPGVQSRGESFGLLEPSVSRAPSVGPTPGVPVPRISPPSTSHRHGHGPPPPPTSYSQQ